MIEIIPNWHPFLVHFLTHRAAPVISLAIHVDRDLRTIEDPVVHHANEFRFHGFQPGFPAFLLSRKNGDGNKCHDQGKYK